jgi:nitroreductase
LSGRTPMVLPLIVDTHHEGDLATRAAVEAWRKGRNGGGARSVPSLSRGHATERSIEDVILHRGSTRRMLPDALPRAGLEWVMATATQPPPGDWIEVSGSLLEHGVLVHAIEGIAPGVYTMDGAKARLVRDGDVREQGRYVSLKQPQGGDGAYTTFHFADMDRLAKTLGARGYRAAQIEGGYVLERLHLAAYAFGTGATGLTFYDDAVSELFETKSAVMTQVAVGKSSYRAKRGRLGDDATKLTGNAFELFMARIKELEKTA